MNQGTREGKFLLHTSGQSRRLPFFKRLKLRKNILNHIIILIYRRAEKGTEKIQIFLQTKIRIERKTPRHIPYDTANFIIMLHHIVTANRSLSAIRKNKGGKNPEYSGLTPSVR